MTGRDGNPAAGAGEADAASVGEEVPGGAGTSRRGSGEELRRGEPFDLVSAPDWSGHGTGIAAGVTRAAGGADFGLTTAGSAWTVLDRLERLRDQLGFLTLTMPRQVHGGRVASLEWRAPAGVVFVGECDGLVTDRPGILLVVTAADCVPVYLHDPERGVVGLLHAGWRGIASGVLEEGLRRMTELGAAVEELRVYLGPAICRECYPVGPEVFRALGLEGGDQERGRLDLREALASRVRASGVRPGRLVVSRLCTRCRPDLFHSHRGSGERAGRMAAFVGRRPVHGGADEGRFGS